LAPISRVTEEIQPRLEGYLLALGIDWRSVAIRVRKPKSSFPARLLRHRSHQIFKIELESKLGLPLEESLFVKIHRDRQSADNEFRNLSVVWEAFRSSSKFRVPRPLDVLGELNAIVTTGGKGLCLGASILESRFKSTAEKRVRELSDSVCRAAEWLQFLHHLEISDRSSVDSRREIVMELRSLIRQARQLGFPRNLASEVQSRFASLDWLSEASDIAVVHRDFNPENVLLGDTVFVTDFETLGLGLEAEDWATFWAYFDMHLLQLNLRTLIPCLKAHFLRTVGANKDADNELLAVFSIAYFMRRWSDSMSNLSKERIPYIYANSWMLGMRAIENIRLVCQKKDFP